MRDIVAIFFGITLITVVFCGAILMGMNYWLQYECGKYQDITGRETKWVFMNACYISTKSEWLTKEEYKAVIIAREGLQDR